MEHGQLQVNVAIVTYALCQRLPTHVTVGIFLTSTLRQGGRGRGEEGRGGHRIDKAWEALSDSTHCNFYKLYLIARYHFGLF